MMSMTMRGPMNAPMMIARGVMRALSWWMPMTMAAAVMARWRVMMPVVPSPRTPLRNAGCGELGKQRQ